MNECLVRKSGAAKVWLYFVFIHVTTYIIIIEILALEGKHCDRYPRR
jgi:hypothetical protein